MESVYIDGKRHVFSNREYVDWSNLIARSSCSLVNNVQKFTDKELQLWLKGRALHLEVVEIICKYLREDAIKDLITRECDLSVIFQAAAKYGRLEFLMWLTEEFKLTKIDATARQNSAFRQAAKHGYLEVCQFIAETFHITKQDALICDNYALNWVIKNGEIRVFNWMVEYFHITREDIDDIQALFIVALQSGRLDMIKWVKLEFRITANEVPNYDDLENYLYEPNISCKARWDIYEWYSNQFCTSFMDVVRWIVDYVCSWF